LGLAWSRALLVLRVLASGVLALKVVVSNAQQLQDIRLRACSNDILFPCLSLKAQDLFESCFLHIKHSR